MSQDTFGASALAAALPASRGRALDYVILTKPRISVMVALTAAAGYILAAGGALNAALLLHVCAGTFLAAAGAGALNMLWEKDLDARMRRTANRPIPAGRLGESEALLFGMALSVAGIAWLTFGAGLLPGIIAALTLNSYLFVYTPLKTVTTLNTAVGAVPGALPPMIGWAAATGRLDFGAWALFSVLFLWQMPHFLAIARMYREDYARAGFMMLPVVDGTGAQTGLRMTGYALALIPASLSLYWAGLAGAFYFFGAAVLGLLFFVMSAHAARRSDELSARRLLLASVAYLPLLLALMVMDRA